MPTLPTAFFPNYDHDATNAALVIPVASLPGLTAAEASESAGDGRKVCYELVKKIQQQYAAMVTKPAGMNATIGTPTGVSPGVIRQTFTLTFDLAVGDADLTPEP